jgi:hypothetical protein
MKFYQTVNTVQLANGGSPTCGYTTRGCAPSKEEIELDIVPMCDGGFKALYYTRDYYNTVQRLAEANTFCELADKLLTEWNISFC